ncbi:MAG: TAXI family TRAP transporter solute-binding subunit [Candidatus Binatia bacterium]
MAKGKYWILFLGLLAGLLVAAHKQVEAAGALPRVVSIGTNPAGTLFYAIGSGLAKVISERSPIRAKVQAYAGTTVFMVLVNTGEVELGVNNAIDMHLAYRGIDRRYPTIPNVRLLQRGAPLLTGMLVRNDSGIRSVKDVKGKRVAAEFKAQVAVWYNMTAALANGGLTWDDVKPVPVSNVNEGVDALIEGRVAVALHALGAGKVKEADASIRGGARFVSLDTSPEAVKRMQKVAPYRARVFKAGSSTAVREDTALLDYDIYLTASKDLSDDAAYEITKSLWDFSKELKPIHPRFAEWVPKRAVHPGATIPYHPGAIRFYQERGAWTSEMDRVQLRLLKEAGSKR